MKSPLLIQLLLGISLLLSFFSWGKRILFPFQIFTTWVHECWHALVAGLLGGTEISITLSPDGSGLTLYRIARSRIRESLIASAGYLGACATGCTIFYLAAVSPKPGSLWSADSMALTLASLIALSVLFWIRNLFGVMSGLILAAAVASLYYPPVRPYARSILLFLGIQTALNAVFDIRTLFGLSKSTKSDAHTLQKLFFFPFWFWAFLWLGLSLFMMYTTAMSIETLWGHLFKPETRNSGAKLVAQEKISLSSGSDTGVHAYVRVAPPIKVNLVSEMGSPTITADCGCPASRKGQFCKHIWATFLLTEGKFPDFFSGKKNLDKAASSTDARTVKQDEYKETAKQKASEYRKAEYQRQKARIKQQKLGKSASPSKGSRAGSPEVEAALAYFSLNGFPMENGISEEVLSEAKRKLSRIFHPDRGGSHDEVVELNQHWDVLSATLRG